jgi:hypothetical protein
LFSAISVIGCVGSAPSAACRSASVAASDWISAVSAATASSLVCASQIRISIVPSRGWGRTSHQMYV